jgi:hypothetical protein
VLGIVVEHGGIYTNTGRERNRRRLQIFFMK